MPIFTLQKGAVQHFFTDKITPTDYFLTVFDDNIMNNILFQTNLYIQQHHRKVKPVTSEEFYGFIGLQFLFGYHWLPQQRHYWCQDIDLSVPIVNQTMPRDRYDQILSNLHVNDNQNIPANNKDKLYKLRPMINDLNTNFQKMRLPDQFQCVDESMILFKGRSSLKQYNPMKPIKRGYKLWCRADMSGYIYMFDVYQGKKEETNNQGSVFGLGGRVVQQLTEQLENKNYVIVMDNFFSSIELYEHLKGKKINACGTVRSNRSGLPSLANDKTLKRGDFDHRVSAQGISFFKWKDNRSVHLLSNFHGNDTTSVQRRNKDGTREDVKAPTIVRDYNNYMGGVDKADMLRSLYDRDRKSKKWWHRLFFAFLEIALVNAYVIYIENHEKMSMLQFKRNVTQGLLAKGRSLAKKRGRPTKAEDQGSPNTVSKRRKGFSVSKDLRLQNRGGHWPEFVTKRARCEWCAMKKMESRPHSRCTLCKVFLCVNEKKNCFFDYHQA